MKQVYFGNSPVRSSAGGSLGGFVHRDGERYYKISNYHEMPPFLLSLVSGSDHWMFVSSNGGLTCGRGSPESALFPYYTDDKIHDACFTTGPMAILLLEKKARTLLWRPFDPAVGVYDIERNLYKNRLGNRLVFEEINHDLELVYSYSWSSSEQFGFVKKTKVESLGNSGVRIEILDGLRNVLPYGVTRDLQTTMSTLVDAYKQAEAIPDLNAAIYTLSSILTDRAEPSEALKATVAWSLGLNRPRMLLSEDQVDAYCRGVTIQSESFKRGKRGAFFVQSSFRLSHGEEKSWYLVADINQSPSELPGLLELLRQGVAPDSIELDIDEGSQRLWQLAGSADGRQMSSDTLVTGRHLSNTLFNLMRGGIFFDEYRFPVKDFLKFVDSRNVPLRQKFGALFSSESGSEARFSVIEKARNSGDGDLERIALEYLPLTFSRRHGDPSRPWNQFSIDIRNADGSDKLGYQGNWRDIFQNWEALAIAYPEYIESFITKFVNASTADGYNPYRISQEGFEWEVLDLDDPWSNIGYWGDHQVNYLLSFLELSRRYHPGELQDLLDREIFAYANVPYRLKGYESLLADPRNSVNYDEDLASVIFRRVQLIGSDGKLLTLSDGSIHRVSLLEKLLVTVLAKVGNLVPGGGIWMNTQRPEWNDANNALVGYGLSMVTLCHLRRFLVFMADLLSGEVPDSFRVSQEVEQFFRAADRVLKSNADMLDGAISPAGRKTFMYEMGKSGEDYRERVYLGFSGVRAALDTSGLLAFFDLARAFLDHSIASNRRSDGLFHSYNLVHFDDQGHHVERLGEMLEGQVAVLNSGYLSAQDSTALLDALRASDIYRSDQNSYMLYPDRKLPLFLDKNVIDPAIVQASPWIKAELVSGRREFVERDINGGVHFNGAYRNAGELAAALNRSADVSEKDSEALCQVYEQVLRHRSFTGRSGAMYKYEGLGCIYWHMVSKLLLATGEMVEMAANADGDRKLLDGLIGRYYTIKDGLGINKTPSHYGAFPTDPYSHTPAFAGVQQPGMTGQVKEDVITRFSELGVKVVDGELGFSPVLLRCSEFLSTPQIWRYSAGGEEKSEELQAGSLAFTLCGVPVIYRLAESRALHVHTDSGDPRTIPGERLGQALSRSLFRRDKTIRKIIVDILETGLS